MGAIKWEELSDKEFRKVLRMADSIRKMSNQDLEKEISEIKEKLPSLTDRERQELLERLELLDKEKSIREIERGGKKKEEKPKKEEAEKPKEKAPRKRFSLPKVKLIKPLPPIWKKP